MPLQTQKIDNQILMKSYLPFAIYEKKNYRSTDWHILYMLKFMKYTHLVFIITCMCEDSMTQIKKNKSGKDN